MVLLYFTYTGGEGLFNELGELGENCIDDINTSEYKDTQSDGNFRKHDKEASDNVKSFPNCFL